MIKLPTLLVMGLAGAASGLLFHISYEVQALDEELASLNREILFEQESIRVLRAEWAFLNRPSRLRELGTQFSGLSPMTAGQIVASIEEIPMPLPGPPEMPGYPVPSRKPDPSAPLVPGDGPALVAEPAPALMDREGVVPAIVEATPEMPAFQPTGPLVRVSAPAPAADPLAAVLADFRARRTGGVE